MERLLKRSIATADELAWKLLHNLVVAGSEDVASRVLVHSRGVMALLQVGMSCSRSFNAAFLAVLYGAYDQLAGNESAFICGAKASTDMVDPASSHMLIQCSFSSSALW